MYVTTGCHLNLSMNLEIRQQQCCIICIKFKLRANKMIIQEWISAFSPDQSVLKLPKFCSTATRLQRRRRKSRLLRSTVPRPVCESSFWTSKELYETSQSLELSRSQSDTLFTHLSIRVSILIAKHQLSELLPTAVYKGKRTAVGRVRLSVGAFVCTLSFEKSWPLGVNGLC